MSGYEWRYLPDGKVKHALRNTSARHAVCSVGPRWYDPRGWFGTGSQTEYDTVAALRPCKRCVTWVGAS